MRLIVVLVMLLAGCSQFPSQSGKYLGELLLLYSASQCSVTLMGGSSRCPLHLSGTVTTLSGTGAPGNVNGSATTSQFNQPRASVTPDGVYLYVVDTGNVQIRRVTIATGEVSFFSGAGVSGFVNGAPGVARFSVPVGITSDGVSLFVVDQNNHAIRQVNTSTGEVSTLAGSGSIGLTDGTGTGAEFNNPVGITTDGTFLYVGDNDNHAIRKIRISTGQVTTLAGSGGPGNADGTGAAASFTNPYGVTTDGTYVYVADRTNSRIRRVTISTGQVTTIAGSSNGLVDGIGTAAQLTGPVGITMDGTHLYVAEINNHVIRKINIGTLQVTTLAGNGSTGFINGTGTAARFNAPTGITTDGRSLFIADDGNFAHR
ncbi:MAG: SMP-30/gluconolactonase/LRE family protein, partial [Leptospirales bacterium]|nr:SMP-30/gluconolactonase/LRE family protein [Leptospirales bacterium]